jgi:hypothetical protein
MAFKVNWDIPDMSTQNHDDGQDPHTIAIKAYVSLKHDVPGAENLIRQGAQALGT